MKRQPLSDLIRRVSQAMTAAYTKREPAITLPQLSLLRALLKNGPQTQTALRNLSGLDRSTTSATLRRLATAGRVVNVRVDSDKRVLLVSITPAGREALALAEEALAAAELEVVKMIPRVKRPYFKDALQAIADGAQA